MDYVETNTNITNSPDGQKCCYLPPVVIGIVVVIVVIIIAAITIRTLICVRERPECRRWLCRDTYVTPTTAQSDLEAGDDPYILPPEYDECVDNPLYRKPSHKCRAVDNTGFDVLHDLPTYDQIEKGEYETIVANDAAALVRLRHHMMSKSREALDTLHTEGGNDVYTSASDINDQDNTTIETIADISSSASTTDTVENVHQCKQDVEMPVKPAEKTDEIVTELPCGESTIAVEMDPPVCIAMELSIDPEPDVLVGIATDATGDMSKDLPPVDIAIVATVCTTTDMPAVVMDVPIDIVNEVFSPIGDENMYGALVCESLSSVCSEDPDQTFSTDSESEATGSVTSSSPSVNRSTSSASFSSIPRYGDLVHPPAYDNLGFIRDFPT